MAEYKLIAVLPQSAPGSGEYHYGHKCEVRSDGIYAELDDVTAENFLVAKRIEGPVKYTIKQAKVEVESVAEDKPQTMTEVIENGSGKRTKNKEK